MRSAFGEAVIDDPDAARTPEQLAAPDPLPVALRSVRYRYPNASVDALVDVTLDVAPAELLAVIGSNGSGKSTLTRLLAGRRAPSAGEIVRPGAVGLGREGGTAIVSQRPEAQVLGVRVRDDVVWGMSEPGRVDVEAFLDRVGLRSLVDRETSTLSGGELQRLAIAAALARRPRFLISDESTAMVDETGRALLVALFRDLAHDDGLGVVHVTHRAAEAAAADRSITLSGGRVVETPARLRSDVTLRADAKPVRHTPAPDSARRSSGSAASVTCTPAGRRGRTARSARSTSRSVPAKRSSSSGTTGRASRPSHGSSPACSRRPKASALLGDKPIADQVGRVGLSFQHARLQLLRPSVLEEVRAAGGVDDREARAALTAVGLDAFEFGSRRVDELSGGQMRRVVLAGVLASRPRAIVLDEPFAGLDADGRADLDTLLSGVRRRNDLALVIVSHDRDLPDGLVDRIIELEAGRITATSRSKTSCRRRSHEPRPRRRRARSRPGPAVTPS